jgi:hypothetical protein
MEQLVGVEMDEPVGPAAAVGEVGVHLLTGLMGLGPLALPVVLTAAHDQHAGQRLGDRRGGVVGVVEEEIDLARADRPSMRDEGQDDPGILLHRRSHAPARPAFPHVPGRPGAALAAGRFAVMGRVVRIEPGIPCDHTDEARDHKHPIFACERFGSGDSAFPGGGSGR